MASFETVDYSVRPNKNVERKMIFETLKHLSKRLDFHKYSYIGMGSMWFTDFIMAHKILRLSSMESIEHEEHAGRSDFNRPYNCIDVIAGDTSLVLPALNWDRDVIAWLDYDTGLEGPAVKDIELISQRAKTNTVVIVTVNASKTRIPKMNDNDESIDPIEGLTKVIGDLVPASLKPSDLGARNYPKTVIKILNDHLASTALKSGLNHNYYPIFSLIYKDNAPMITVGGIFADDDTREFLDNDRSLHSYEWVTGTSPYKINVPLLTPKEKFTLDTLMPNSDDRLDEKAEELFKFKFKPEQLKSYKDFYHMYPVFGEMSI